MAKGWGEGVGGEQPIKGAMCCGRYDLPPPYEGQASQVAKANARDCAVTAAERFFGNRIHPGSSDLVRFSNSSKPERLVQIIVELAICVKIGIDAYRVLYNVYM